MTKTQTRKKSAEEFKKEFNPEFMKRAIELSRRGSIIEKTGGVFGAVIVKDGRIVGEGYNQVLKQKDPEWHAEMQAIREACKKLGTHNLEGCVLYTSGESCPMCLATAYWAHLDHIYYGATTDDALTYGKFDDIDILDEIRKEPSERRISSSQHMHKEAVEVWKEFAKMPGRAHY